MFWVGNFVLLWSDQLLSAFDHKHKEKARYKSLIIINYY